MIIYYLFVVSLPLVSHRILGSDVGSMTVPKYLGLACLGYALLMLGRRRGAVRLLATSQARWFVVLYSLAVLSYVLGSIGAQGGNWNVLQAAPSRLGDSRRGCLALRSRCFSSPVCFSSCSG